METIKNTTKGGTHVDRLLKCRKTQRYFSGRGWTPEVAHAKAFPSQFEAVLDCIQHGLSDVELVLRSPGGGAELFSTALR